MLSFKTGANGINPYLRLEKPVARQGGKRSVEEKSVLFPDQVDRVSYQLSLVRSHLNQCIQDQSPMQYEDCLRTLTKVNKAMRMLHGEPE